MYSNHREEVKHNNNEDCLLKITSKSCSTMCKYFITENSLLPKAYYGQRANGNK